MMNSDRKTTLFDKFLPISAKIHPCLRKICRKVEIWTQNPTHMGGTTRTLNMLYYPTPRAPAVNKQIERTFHHVARKSQREALFSSGNQPWQHKQTRINLNLRNAREIVSYELIHYSGSPW